MTNESFIQVVVSGHKRIGFVCFHGNRTSALMITCVHGFVLCACVWKYDISPNKIILGARTTNTIYKKQQGRGWDRRLPILIIGPNRILKSVFWSPNLMFSKSAGEFSV